MPAIRPRIVSGMVWFQIVPRKIALIMSAAPANAKATKHHSMLGANPAAMMKAPYAAAEITMARPCLLTRPVQPDSAVAIRAPKVWAEYKHSQEFGSVEHVLGEGREEDHREGQEHGRHVDQVGTEQIAAIHGVRQTRPDAAKARRRRLLQMRIRPQQHEQGRGDGEANDVNGETPTDAGVRHQQATQRRTRQQTGLHPKAGERVGGRDFDMGHGAWHQRLAGRSLESGGGDQEGGEDEDHPHLWIVRERVDRQEGREDSLRDAGGNAESTPIDMVGQRSAVQAEDD